MSCENCDCYDCRVDRGEIDDCNRGYIQAQRAGRYVNNFGQFRAWLTEGGMARFQYNEYGADNDSEYWTPTDGDECCFEGTFGMLHAMPEFQSNLEVWARRRYWRSPEDFAALQTEYNRNNESSRQYYMSELEQARNQYNAQYLRWREEDQQLRDALVAMTARAEAAEASQVQLSVLHERSEDPDDQICAAMAHMESVAD